MGPESRRPRRCCSRCRPPAPEPPSRFPTTRSPPRRRASRAFRANPRRLELPRAAAPSVHGAERAQQHPQRRLPDRYLPQAGPLGRDMTVHSIFEAADCASVTFDTPWADRHDLRGVPGAAARGEGPAHARGPLAVDDAAAAQPRRRERVHRLLRRRLLLPRQPRPGRCFPTTHPARVRGGSSRRPADGLAEHASATTTSPARCPRGTRSSPRCRTSRGRIWFASVERRGRHHRPGGGGGALAPLGEPIANSFAVDETGRGLHRHHGGRCTASRRRPTARRPTIWREDVPQHGRARSRGRRAPGRAPRPR